MMIDHGYYQNIQKLSLKIIWTLVIHFGKYENK
jgi:hypothetical protein